jgi:two-component system, sensor histidine kinase YesM
MVVKAKRGYYFIQFSEKSNWKLVSYVSYKTLFSSYGDTVKILLAALIGGFLGIIVFLVPLLSMIIKPLHILSAVMKNISADNYAVHVNIHTNDEIGVLSDSFNHMLDQIQINTNRLVKNERESYRLKQGLLIARINPHFIYNTLNTITYLARRKKTDDIIVVNNALIELLQDTLRVTDTELYDTLDHELAMVGKYVIIQRYRYKDSFKVEVSVDENLLQQQIPKGIIQPLVENSLFHGFVSEDENSGYWIKIEAVCDGNFLILRVSDNGAGIPQEQLKSLLQTLNTENEAGHPLPGKSVGIRNIWQRLHFLYSGDKRFFITSSEGKGTEVTILLNMNADINSPS